MADTTQVPAIQSYVSCEWLLPLRKTQFVRVAPRRALPGPESLAASRFIMMMTVWKVCPKLSEPAYSVSMSFRWCSVTFRSEMQEHDNSSRFLRGCASQLK